MNPRIVLVAALLSCLINPASANTLTFSADLVGPPVPLSSYSNNDVTFSSGQPYFSDVEINPANSYGGVIFGNQGEFTATFSQSVSSVGLSLFPAIDGSWALSVGPASVTAIYKDANGGVMGTNSGLVQFHFEPDSPNIGWIANNFVVSSAIPFKSVTFDISGGQWTADPPVDCGGFSPCNPVVTLPLPIGSGGLEYTFASPPAVPEAATKILLISGLILLGGLMARRETPNLMVRVV